MNAETSSVHVHYLIFYLDSMSFSKNSQMILCNVESVRNKKHGLGLAYTVHCIISKNKIKREGKFVSNVEQLSHDELIVKYVNS